MAPTSSELRDFYEQGYRSGGDRGLIYERWRALGAKGKADHVLALLPADVGNASEASLLEVGCGDGALLAELRTRRPAWRFAGVEIAAAPAALAAERNPDADVREYDGDRLPHADDVFDVGVISHVLEHVPDPVALLRETARACRWVVVEVPLEANLSARRASKTEHSVEVGHLQRFAAPNMRAIIAAAGLRVRGELTDPLPREVHRFFADGRAGRLRADAKWLVRSAVHRGAPQAAARLFTVHYAALCGR